MTVAELITHLQTLPQETEVFCLLERQNNWTTWCEWKALELDDLSFTDLRGNPFVKEGQPHFNKISLEIGSK